MVLKSGSYTGNGSSQDINVGGIGGTPDFVAVMNGDNGVYGCFVTSVTDANKTYYFGNDTSNFANGITLGTNKFSVDSNININGNGKKHFWIAIKNDGASDFKVGSYVGNGSAGHGITGIGFQPDAVIIKANTTVTNQSIALESDSTNAGKTSDFGSIAAGATTKVTSLDADGFTVGSGTGCNDNGTTYFYIAIKNVANKFKVLSYTGNGSSGHGITGVGFKPDLTWVFDYTTARMAIGRHRDSSGADQSFGLANTGYETSGITSLDSDGFTLGTSVRTNTNTEAYQSMNFLAPIPIFVVAVNDTITLVETVIKFTTKLISDSISNSESVVATKVFVKSVLDTISNSESIVRSTTKVIVDILTGVENLAKQKNTTISDSSTITDSSTEAKIRFFTDNLTLSEIVSKYIHGLLFIGWEIVKKVQDLWTKVTKPDF